MSDECFMCVEPASDEYTVILPDGTILENKTVCESCLSDLRKTEWLNVIEGPVMTRGENDNDDGDDG